VNKRLIVISRVGEKNGGHRDSLSLAAARQNGRPQSKRTPQPWMETPDQFGLESSLRKESMAAENSESSPQSNSKQPVRHGKALLTGLQGAELKSVNDSVFKKDELNALTRFREQQSRELKAAGHSRSAKFSRFLRSIPNCWHFL
jgi:hypothetical protein